MGQEGRHLEFFLSLAVLAMVLLGVEIFFVVRLEFSVEKGRLHTPLANRDVCRQSKNSDCTHKRSIFYGSGAYHACCCICLLLHTSYGRDMSDSLC